MSSWTGLDFFIFLILLMNILLGMSRGASKEIISTLCLCAALVFAIRFTMPLTEFLNKSPLINDQPSSIFPSSLMNGILTSQFVQNFMRAIDMPPLTRDMLLNVNYSVSLLICFVGAFSVCEAVLAYTNIVEAFPFRYAFLNRKLGAGFGAMRGFVITLVLIIVLQHLYAGNVPASNFINMFRTPARKLDNLITARAPERYKEVLENSNLYNPEMILDMLRNPR